MGNIFLTLKNNHYCKNKAYVLQKQPLPQIYYKCRTYLSKFQPQISKKDRKKKLKIEFSSKTDSTDSELLVIIFSCTTQLGKQEKSKQLQTEIKTKEAEQ